MRPHFVPLATLLAISISVPAWAQSRTPATPDTVVARLMSFDRNTDGRIVADELPDRMQSLLARGDTSKDGALDPAEVRRLAMSPVRQVSAQNGLEPGRWGAGGGFIFDTSQHIEGALDDLRLAADTKERALDITRQFLASANAKAMDDLLATMGALLNGGQLDDFRGAVKGRKVSVPAVRRDGVTFFGATAAETAGHERVMVDVRLTSNDLERYIEKYTLDVDRKPQALAAVRQFRAHIPGLLNETERVALVEQFRGLLTDEQRDDLRAALARRPVVRLTGIVPAAARTSEAPTHTEVNGRFVVRDLLLRP